ncbi:MAG: GPW/gp25 family protein [Enterobacteriaceae bacterium]|jgi:type VI secretion system protein ImpF|nr:GPW/gp25 family protein [Enterobacteriaceae bacterium]
MNDSTISIHGGYIHRRNSSRITARDRMQPSLLDKLTDNDPMKKKEASISYLISNRTLRQNLRRDLQWLLNSINSEADQDLTLFPEIRRSVYNFGLVPLAGKNMSDIKWEDVQHKIIRAIHTFEPRIIPDNLEITCISDIHSQTLYNILSIEIKGFLWCIPWPIEFLFRSDIDLETGYFSIQ